MFKSTSGASGSSSSGNEIAPARAKDTRRFRAKAARRRRSITCFSSDRWIPESLEARMLLTGFAVQLLRDVNAVDLFPSNLIPAGNNLFYLVSDGTQSGVQLAATNSSGTQFLKDFGADNNPLAQTYGGGGYAVVGNSLYFLDQTYGGTDLWVSDGNVAGTHVAVTPGETISDLVSAGGRVFFSTYGGGAVEQDSLYTYTPGSANATLVATVPNGSISNLTAFGNSVDFAVIPTDTEGFYDNSFTILTSDGSLAGTGPVAGTHMSNATLQQILSFNSSPLLAVYSYPTDGSGTSSSLIGVKPSGLVTYSTQSGYFAGSGIVAAGSNLYFSNYDSTNGTELWKLDGSTLTASLVKDIIPSTGSSNPTDLTAVNGLLYFHVIGSDGSGQLWKSDGTAGGTQFITNLGVSASYQYTSQNPSDADIAGVGSTVFFTANDPAHGFELWATDGTVAGTAVVKDIDPGIDSSAPHSLVAWQGQLYFSAHDGSNSPLSQLWKSNGTAGGTVLAASLTQSATGDSFQSYSSTPIGAADSLVFMALSDGIHPTATWVTNGTSQGTIQLAPGTPNGFQTLGALTYFTITSTNGSSALWKTDGTLVGTLHLADFGQFSLTLLQVGNLAYFNAYSVSTFNTGLWRTDGTVAGTCPIPGISYATNGFGSIGNLVYFLGQGNDFQQGLWKTDGTAAGTVKIVNLTTGSPQSLTTFGNKILSSRQTTLEAPSASGRATGPPPARLRSRASPSM